MLSFFKELYIQMYNEPIGLQLLKSSLITKRPLKVIKNAEELLSKDGKTRLVAKLEEIKHLIANEGQDLFEVLFSYEFISKKTYYELKSISEITKLEAEHIENYIDKTIKEKELKRSVEKEVFSYYVFAFVAFAIFVMNVKQFKPYVVKYMQNNPLYDFFYNIATSTTMDIVFVIVGTAVTILLIKSLINVLISRKQEFFSFISIISLLRQAGISYMKIFENLLSQKLSKKLHQITLEVYEKLQIENVAEALIPISYRLSIADRLIFIDRIETGDDLYAWKFYQENLYKQLENEITKLKPTLSLTLTMFIIIVALISLIPLFYGVSDILNSL